MRESSRSSTKTPSTIVKTDALIVVVLYRERIGAAISSQSNLERWQVREDILRAWSPIPGALSLTYQSVQLPRADTE
ncbi:MAG: hypothetical protein AB8C46_24015 [Burkholderiaceae bacterium]